jgi:hypothetical protein
MSLQAKAMLLACHISKWDGTIRDATASKQFMIQNNMSDNAGIFSKYLIDKESLKPIEQATNKIRQFHHKMTIPWSLEGVGLITNDKLLSYTQGVKPLKDAFYDSVKNFLDHYEIYISDARKRLGARFNLNEFPSKDELIQKFQVNIYPLPVPSSEHLLHDLTGSGLDATDIDKAVEQATDKAMQRLWSSLYSRLTMLQQTLADPERRVFKSHFELLEEYINKIEEFNMFDNQTFRHFVTFVRHQILAPSLTDIKTAPEIRLEVLDKIGQAIEAAYPFIGSKNDEKISSLQSASA